MHVPRADGASVTRELIPHGQISLDTADIRLIRIFIRVVEAGGLSAAQPELNLSLSSISEKISALEQRLGVKLCNRGRSGFSLTEHGRQVFDEATRMLVSLEQFSKRVSGLKSRLTGTLSIGIVDNTITDPNSPFAAAVAAMVETAPNISFSVETRPPGELLRDVVGQKLDLAISSFPRVSLGLAYIDLYDETQNFYCGKNHPLFAVPDSEIGIETVRKHRIIGRSYWAARDIKIFAISAPHATVSNMEAEAHLILSGAYLGYLPDHFAAQFVSQGLMRSIRPDIFSYRARFQVATHEDWKKKPRVRAFIEILEQICQKG